MSLSQQILQIWTDSSYDPPTVQLIYYEGDYMVTIDDSETFLRFMSSDGQIYLALNKNCQQSEVDSTIVYFCDKLDPILCSPTKGPETSRDMFVLNNIIPLLL